LKSAFEVGRRREEGGRREGRKEGRRQPR